MLTHHNKKTILIPIIRTSSRTRSFGSIFLSTLLKNDRGTSISRSLTVVIVKRFSGREPFKKVAKTGVSGAAKEMAPKPLPPSPSSTKKPLPPTTSPDKPIPSVQAKSPQQWSNSNTYVKGASKEFKDVMKQTSSSEKVFTMQNPNLAFTLWQSQKQGSFSNNSTSSVPNAAQASSGSSISPDSHTTTTISSNVNTTSSEKLTPITGALVVYKPQNNHPVNSHGDAFLNDVPVTNISIPPLPSQIPENTKIPHSSKETDQSVIDKTVAESCYNLSPDQLKEELLKRGLVKLTTDKITEFITIDGKTISVGKALNGFKVTPFGIAYSKEALSKKEFIPSHNVKEPPEYSLAIPSIGHKAFLLHAIHKHPLPTVKIDAETYMIPGYFTSKEGPIVLAEYQFKAFQDAKELNLDISVITKKPQHMEAFEKAVIIKKHELTFLKWAPEYLKEIKAFPYLSKLCSELKDKPCLSYDANGFSFELLIKMCVNFDNHVRNKIPHPKTLEQLANEAKIKKTNEDNKEAYLEHKNKMKRVFKELYSKKTNNNENE